MKITENSHNYIMNNKLCFDFWDLVAKDTSAKKSGDSILVSFPTGEHMLIDCGMPECGLSIVKRLKAMNIKKLEYFAASHLHVDHIGGFPELADNIEISKVISVPAEYFINFKSPAVSAFSKTLKKYNLSPLAFTEKKTLEIGEVSVISLNPPINFPRTWEEYEDKIKKEQSVLLNPMSIKEKENHMINDASITMKFSFGKSSCITAGDIYFTGEQSIIQRYQKELDCDLIKTNHHGAYTSNSKAWIIATKPKVAITLRDSIPPQIPESYLNYWSTHIDGYSYAEFPKQGIDHYLTFWNGNIHVEMGKFHDINVTVEKGIKNMIPKI